MNSYKQTQFRTNNTYYRVNKPEPLSEDQKIEIKEAFELFDSDKDNHLDYHELKVLPIPCYFIDPSLLGCYESPWFRC